MLSKEVQEIIHHIKLVLRLLDLRSFVSMVSEHFTFGSHDRVLGEQNWMYNFPEISCVYYCKTVIY